MVEIKIRKVEYWKNKYSEYVIENRLAIVVNGRCYVPMKDKRLHMIGHKNLVTTRTLIPTPEIKDFCQSINLELA